MENEARTMTEDEMDQQVLQEYLADRAAHPEDYETMSWEQAKAELGFSRSVDRHH